MIPGLARDTNGRWRVVATGYRWTDENEEREITKFRQMTGGQTAMVWIGEPETLPASHVTPEDIYAAEQINRDLIQTDGDQVIMRAGLPEDFIYPIMRQLLLADPAKCARMTGIPQLANLAHMICPSRASRSTRLPKHTTSIARAKARYARSRSSNR